MKLMNLHIEKKLHFTADANDSIQSSNRLVASVYRP